MVLFFLLELWGPWFRVSKCIQDRFIWAYIASYSIISIYLKYEQAQSSYSIFMFMDLFMKPLLMQDVPFTRNPNYNNPQANRTLDPSTPQNISKYPNNARSSDDRHCASALVMFTSSVTWDSHYGAVWLCNLTDVQCFLSHFETLWIKLVKIWDLRWKAKQILKIGFVDRRIANQRYFIKPINMRIMVDN
jgi:hypothetical protein